MPIVYAIFNQSGGVAKTTIVQNLAYHFATDHQKKVLVLDLDPQSSLTLFNGIDPDELEISIADSILQGKDLPIIQTSFGFDLIPADINLAAAELQLVSVMGREYKLKKALSPVIDRYDSILIDCPPSLGLLSILGLCAADNVIVPIQCQYKAIKGTELLLSTIASVQEELNPGLTIRAFIPTMYAQKCSQDSRSLTSIRNSLSEIAIVTSELPRATALSDASELNRPVAIAFPNHKIVSRLKAISRQVLGGGN